MVLIRVFVMTSDKRGGALPPFHNSKDEELLKQYELWEDTLIWLAESQLEQQDEPYRQLQEQFDLAYHALICYGSGCASVAEEKRAMEFPAILKQLMDHHAAYLFRSGFRSFFHLYNELTIDRLMERCDECKHRRW